MRDDTKMRTTFAGRIDATIAIAISEWLGSVQTAYRLLCLRMWLAVGCWLIAYVVVRLLIVGVVKKWPHPIRYDELDFFFFFQAEDGIRDLIVTGVQTCALPI